MVIIKIVVAAAAAAGIAGMLAPAPSAGPEAAQSPQARPVQDRPIIDFNRLGHAFR